MTPEELETMTEMAETIRELGSEIERLRKENEGYEREYLEVKRLLKEAQDEVSFAEKLGNRSIRAHVEERMQEARREALEEAEQIANEHSLECEDDGIRVALAIRQDIRALKDTGAD